MAVIYPFQQKWYICEAYRHKQPSSLQSYATNVYMRFRIRNTFTHVNNQIKTSQQNQKKKYLKNQPTRWSGRYSSQEKVIAFSVNCWLSGPSRRILFVLSIDIIKVYRIVHTSSTIAVVYFVGVCTRVGVYIHKNGWIVLRV